MRLSSSAFHSFHRRFYFDVLNSKVLQSELGMSQRHDFMTFANAVLRCSNLGNSGHHYSVPRDILQSIIHLVVVDGRPKKNSGLSDETSQFLRALE